MALMRRVLAGVLLALAVWGDASAQDLTVLRLKVTVLGADRQPIPVARHALLISDNPATAVPRRVVTSLDGTAEIRLRPGNYTVESERPFVLDGRSYEWIQIFDIVVGPATTLELTTDAAAGVVTADLPPDTAAAPRVRDPRESILGSWQASVFEVWTPLARASGFLADAHGLVATSLRAIGDAPSVEVQISRTVKVAGTVVVADTSRDVAMVRVHPSAMNGIRSVPLACDAAGPDRAAPDRYVIHVPLFGPTDISPWLDVSTGAAGGPVFDSEGRAVGLASLAGPRDERGRADIRLVGRESVCEALASARVALDASAPPSAARLPVEPAPRPPAAPVNAAAARAFSFAAYQLSSSDFDILFLTPAVFAAAKARRGWTGGGAEELIRLTTDFEPWSEYVESAPPLLFVRVSPRRVEGFWMRLARGAASTQGAAIPPIKRLRPGFSRMRLVCGGREVTPIHPFRIQTRVTETDAIGEGFYAFDLGAIGPACGTVSIVLSSVKDPDRTETRAVDAAIVRRVREDFASASPN
jgi:hypothetical protein